MQVRISNTYIQRNYIYLSLSKDFNKIARDQTPWYNRNFCYISCNRWFSIWWKIFARPPVVALPSGIHLLFFHRWCAMTGFSEGKIKRMHTVCIFFLPSCRCTFMFSVMLFSCITEKWKRDLTVPQAVLRIFSHILRRLHLDNRNLSILNWISRECLLAQLD